MATTATARLKTTGGVSREKGNKTMTPSTTNGQEQGAVFTKPIQKTVFDLKLFDDLKIGKTYVVPQTPATIEDALAAVGNDKDKLLEVIGRGLDAHARDLATADNTGWKVFGEDGELAEEYSGTFADESKGKKIAAVVLSLAKMQGYEKSLPAEKKAAIKENVLSMLRANPVFLGDLAK